MVRLVVMSGVVIVSTGSLTAVPALTHREPTTVVAQDGCSPFNEPKQLPAIDALLDSAALVAALPAASASTPDVYWISVRPGASPMVFLLDSTLTSPATTVAMGAVTSALRKDARQKMQSFRLRVVPGSPSGLTLDRSVLCGPRPESMGRQGFTVTKVTPANQRPMPLRSVTPKIHIDATGKVQRVDLGSGTGDSQVDRQMEQSMRQTRYHPALLDGRPIGIILSGNRVELVR